MEPKRICRNKGLHKSTSSFFYLPTPIASVPLMNIVQPRKASNQSVSPLRKVKASQKFRLKPLEIYSGNTGDSRYNQTYNFSRPDFTEVEKKSIDWGSHWKNSQLIEDVIRSKLSPIERKYLSSHISPLHGVHRCSKDHIIGSQYKSCKYITHESSPKPLKDYAKAYVEYYQSEPALLQYGEGYRKKFEKTLLAQDSKAPYMSVSYSAEKAKATFFKRKTKVWH